MVRITIDDDLKRKLLSTNELVEFCDSEGNLIASVLPKTPESFDRDAVFPELTPEEAERRCNSDGPWLTTEQVKERLREIDSKSGGPDAA